MPHPGRLASNPTPGPGSANVSHFPLPITGLGVDRYLGRMSASHSVGTGDSGGHSKGPGVRENGEELRGRKEEEENKILEERRGPVVERVMGPGTSFPLLPPPSPEGAWPDSPPQQGWASDSGRRWLWAGAGKRFSVDHPTL